MLTIVKFTTGKAKNQVATDAVIGCRKKTFSEEITAYLQYVKTTYSPKICLKNF